MDGERRQAFFMKICSFCIFILIGLCVMPVQAASPLKKISKTSCDQLISKIPFTAFRRPSAFQHHDLKGDLINLLIETSSPQKLYGVFVGNGWEPASLTRYIENPFFRENDFPISKLYLWHHAQNLAFSRNTSLGLTHRHHVRLWKMPWRCHSKEWWVAAASKDVGVEWNRFSWFSGPTTHRIDPDLDKERDFVMQYFRGFPRQYLERSSGRAPIKGWNGNLDFYFSDGKIGYIKMN